LIRTDAILVSLSGSHFQLEFELGVDYLNGRNDYDRDGISVLAVSLQLMSRIHDGGFKS
jgi:hypothetical protein